MEGMLYVLLVLCIIGSSVSEYTLPYEGFLKAFPNANVTAMYDIPDQVGNANFPREPHFSANCPPIASPAPTDNVNELKPGHIKVVMAMGDSITTGMSAKDTFFMWLDEYRGLAYSIGMDQGITTMPNILKNYAPSLYGGSTGEKQERNGRNNGLNAAVSGAKYQDLRGQAEWLVAKLRADPNVNMASDWKVLTIWMGSNNLCDVCSNLAANDGAGFQTHFENTLDYLRDNVPRLFVNLIAPLDVAELYNIPGVYCSSIHFVACTCAGSPVASERNAVTQMAKDYVERAYSIANKYKLQNRADFAVVVQPFMTNTKIHDKSLLSSGDCFHPSNKGQALAAVALWNNMISPSNLKRTEWHPSDTVLCATGDSKLYTN